MPLDPRLEALRASLPAVVDRSDPPAVRRAAVRARQASTARLIVSAGPELLEERDHLVATQDGDVRVRIYRPREGLLPGLLVIHGGGWWQGSVDDTDPQCRRRAVGADCVVVSVDYRLAPEHPFPAALDDCWAVSRWLQENGAEIGVDTGRLAVTGGSAGGNLAAAVTLRARDAGRSLFRAQVLEVPGMDLTMDDASMDEFGEGYGFTRADLDECAAFYLGDHDPRDPLASPLFADLRGLPPALVFTSECDPLRDGGEAYASRLAAAGVPTTLRRWDGLAHGCGEFDMLLPEIAHAYGQQINSFLRAAFAGEDFGSEGAALRTEAVDQSEEESACLS